MLNIKKECTGCMACVNKCPVSAIKIIEDEYGFVMPEIDRDSCINCDMCIEVCPIEEFEEHVLIEEINNYCGKSVDDFLQGTKSKILNILESGKGRSSS